MDTILTNTASKWIADKPIYAGDLIHNLALYHPKPKYDEDYTLIPALNAEKLVNKASRFKWAHKKAMIYASASNGWPAYQLALRYKKIVMEKSTRLSTPDDTPFLTTQRLADSLDSAGIMVPDIFMRNYANNDTAIEAAATNMPDYAIVGPADFESYLRSIHEIPPMLGGGKFEDWIFEAHLWGPLMLLDMDAGIYTGDHAWSRHAAMEKGVGLAIQYGEKNLLKARQSINFDVVDIKGRDVSIVDQAWEEARHIVDVVERGFRTEPAVALMMSRFMYDDYYQNGNDAIKQELAHPVVHAHYKDKTAVTRMQALRDVMLPYLADRCDWKTMRDALDEDMALKQFWDEKVEPLKGTMKPVDEIQEFVFSHLPRGGFDHPELRSYIKTRTDEPENRVHFNGQAKAPRPKGKQFGPDDPRHGSKLHNQYRFNRLGGTGKPYDTPDPDHYNRDQCDAVHTNGAMSYGRPPVNAPRTLLYLDGSANGYRASDYIHKHKIDDPKELKGKYNSLSAEGSYAYSEMAGAETSDDFKEHIRALALGEHQADWRNENGKIGNIIPVSDYVAASDYSGRREGLNAELHKAIAADGPEEISGDAIIANVAKDIDTIYDGIVIPAGELDDASYRLITEGVLAALGLTGREHGSNENSFDFFYDRDYYKAPHQKRDPEKMDLGDVILLVGMKAKAELEKKNPPKLSGLYAGMAHLLDVYERIIDPGRRNLNTLRDPRTGKDKHETVLEMHKVDPYFRAFAIDDPGMPVFMDDEARKRSDNPEYDAFFSDPEYIAFRENKLDIADYISDPAQKAKLVKMMWAWMRAEEYPSTHNGIKPPVSGNLLVRGIHAFDPIDLDDLHPEYTEAHKWWHNMSKRERADVFRRGVVHVKGPSVAKP